MVNGRVFVLPPECGGYRPGDIVIAVFACGTKMRAKILERMRVQLLSRVGAKEDLVIARTELEIKSDGD
jgi:hypothetical protein